MDPRYSILLCNQDYAEYQDKIFDWLARGIKVIWFSKNKNEIEELKNKYHEFAEAFLLLTYVLRISDQIVIIDGQDRESSVTSVLQEECPLFNADQYLVEHCQSQTPIIVQASAGTGKTKVMVDRILYLMHMVPDLSMSEIYMITFTKDATSQMNQRLQEALLIRYRLTRQQRYLCWLEEQSQMHISTIHSFAFSMLKLFGGNEGFTSNLSIKTFQYEKKELIKDLLDEKTEDGKKVISQLGTSFYRSNRTIQEFWNTFAGKGITSRELEQMDWGQAIDEYSQPFQNVMTGLIEELDWRYFELKRNKDAIGLNDIMRDLQLILQEENLPEADLSMKYLFIDEFQDSDRSQIRVACQLARLMGTVLFVVGDSKQSIYRFRGATDQAFAMLEKTMQEQGLESARQFSLVNNYRTSARVMRRLDEYFRVWNSLGMLQYDRSVSPFNRTPGLIRMIHGKPFNKREEQIGDIIEEEWKVLQKKVRENNISPDKKHRVVVLTRSNHQLDEVVKILKRRKIPCVVKKEGNLYAGAAVRDFYLMISSYLFCDEPKHIFNFLLTPYAGKTEPLDLNEMERLDGDYENLVDYLGHYLKQTKWSYYHHEFRLRPVLSVLKEMIREDQVTEYFMSREKARKRRSGWTEESINTAVWTEGRQYQADLEKVLEILQKQLGDERISLYQIYEFLRLNIASNRSEPAAVIQTEGDYRSVLCMTVHGSKGLEFDTVIIPYTNSPFPDKARTELLVDPEKHKVGWNCEEEQNRHYKYEKMSNTWYEELKSIECQSAAQEECRILYVAMTRAIETLICIVPDSKGRPCWAKLIEEVGVDYE